MSPSVIVSLEPERVDIDQHYRGDTIRMYAVWYEDSDSDGVPDEPLKPIDFTGGGENVHTAVMQVRTHQLSSQLLYEATTESGEIVLNENGEMGVEIHNFLEGFPYKTVWYDIRVKDEMGATQTLQYGTINIQLSVTTIS